MAGGPAYAAGRLMVARMPENFLRDLLASTRARVEDTKQVLTEDLLEQRIAAAEEPRGFAASLKGPATTLIAEVKRATPSKGTLKADLNAGQLSAAYAAGGASAISVLTEPDRFLGSLDDLAAARGAGLPVLRKDFIVDPFQVLESRAANADAVLLIARITGDSLGTLVALTESLGMDALVEIFDETDLKVALDAGASLIGVNHRDLESFEVDPGRTEQLAPSIPTDATLVALSGVSTRPEVVALAEAGAHSVLVGEALVTADDPAKKLEELRGV